MIGYDSSTPVASMTAEEFTWYEGDLNLSVVQLQLPKQDELTMPPLVGLNLKTV